MNKIIIMFIAILLMITSAYADITTGLVGHWTLDDVSGSTLNDSHCQEIGSPKGCILNNGTLVNSPTLTKDAVVGDGGLGFNGSNYVTLANPSSYPITTPFTFSVWTKVTGLSSGSYWALSWGDTTNGVSIRTNGPNWNFLHGSTGIQINSSVSLNNWSLLTGIFDGGHIRLYKDGVLIGGPTPSTPSISTNPVAYIGNRQNNSLRFTGILDDIRIYNRALSDTEIAQLYTEGSGNVIPVTNGVCGSAAKTYALGDAFPTGAYCAAGIINPNTPSNPSVGSSSSWSCQGLNGGTTAPCTASRTSAPIYTLTVSKQGSATGTVKGSGIDCGSTCSQLNILAGTQITLTAAPENNATVNFQGCTSSTASTCSITVNANASITATFSPPVSPADLNRGLVAYYTFDEGSGTTPGDSSLNNNTASFVGNPKWVEGKIGSALSFNGATDYIKFNKDFIGTTPITFCSWIYPAGEVGQTQLISNGKFMVGFGSNNRLGVTNNGISTTTSSSWAITLNSWQHVCATRDLQGLVGMYVNGSLNAGIQNGGLPTPSSVGGGGARLAALDWTGLFKGSMDDVRVYSRVLSAAEIFALSNATSPGVPSASDNRAPIVSVGASQTITIPDPVNLAGVVSDDRLPVGSALTITWSMISGPTGGTVKFGNSNAPSTTATFTKAGNYVLQLSASDSQYTTNAILPITVKAGLSVIPYTSCGTDCYEVSKDPVTGDITEPNFSAAIDASQAANGGIIKLPPGTVTFYSPIFKTITKDLVITGTCEDALSTDNCQDTVINDDIPTGMFAFIANGDVLFHLTNMKIIQVHDLRTSSAAVTVGGTSFRHIVSNITFDHVGEGMGGFILINDQSSSVNGGGVIFGNTFQMHSKSATPTGISIIGSIPANWAESPDWGSPFKWYIEDNIANFTYQHANDIVDSYRGARFVFRYNKVDGTTPGGHGYDSDITGVQSMEVYKNTFTAKNSSGGNNTIRSGTALIWGNTYEPLDGNRFNLTLYRSGLDVRIVSGRCNGTNPMDGNQDHTGYPFYHQPGATGINGITIHPLMEWDNKMVDGSDVQYGYNGNFIPPGLKTSPSEYDHIKEGRDFLNDTTCANLDYTKLDNKTCSDKLDPAKLGIADECTMIKTCKQWWDSSKGMPKDYVPYTYPHPLRTNSRAVLSYANGPAQYVDQTKPYLTAVPSFVSSITATSATITWYTSTATTTQMEYGLTTAYGNTTAMVVDKDSKPVFATGHNQTLTGLIPNTFYHYRFIYKDRAGNTVTSRDGLFTTLASGGSSNPPAITMVFPVDGAQLTAGTNVNLLARALDWDGDETITKVEFYRGAALLGVATLSPNTPPAYTFTWNNIPAGIHAITAMATDNTGTVTTSAAVNVTVKASLGGSGDVSGEGKVTMYDAALVLRYTLGSSLTDAQKQKADMNGDKKIDGADVVAIARKALGL